jgi:hypothetical protein
MALGLAMISRQGRGSQDQFLGMPHTAKHRAAFIGVGIRFSFVANPQNRCAPSSIPKN